MKLLFVLSVACVISKLSAAVSVGVSNLFMTSENDVIRRENEEEIPQQHEEKARDLEKEEKESDDEITGLTSGHLERKEKNKGKRGVEAITTTTLYTTTGASQSKSVQEICVFAHNYLRKKHDTGPLKWDAKLAKGCEDYAKALVSKGVLVHSIRGNFGENLYVSANTYDTVATAGHAILAWYSESWQPKYGKAKNYNYNFEPQTSKELHNAGVGHFTAVVWKGSTNVGCGVATTKYKENGKTYTRTIVVSRYTVTGNMIGQFTANVKPLMGIDATLKGKITVSDCLPGSSACKDTATPAVCSLYKAKYCSVVQEHCNCECP